MNFDTSSLKMTTDFAVSFLIPVGAGYLGAISPIRGQTPPTEHKLSEPHKPRSTT